MQCYEYQNDNKNASSNDYAYENGYVRLQNESIQKLIAAISYVRIIT